MNKEQPPTIEKEKEPTLEDVKRYFEEEREFYSSKGRKMFMDSVIHLKAAERWKKIVGYEEIEGKKGQRMPGLLEKLKKGDHRECLAYIEEILGGSGVEQAASTLDLINHIEYGPHNPLRNRNEDRETREYQARKNYLRKLADVLAGTIYKDRKTELDRTLSAKELIEVREHVANISKKDLSRTENDFKEGNCRDFFEFLDNRIYRELKEITSLKKEENREGIKTHKEELFKLRRYRRYFLNLERKK